MCWLAAMPAIRNMARKCYKSKIWTIAWRKMLGVVKWVQHKRKSAYVGRHLYLKFPRNRVIFAITFSHFTENYFVYIDLKIGLQGKIETDSWKFSFNDYQHRDASINLPPLLVTKIFSLLLGKASFLGGCPLTIHSQLLCQKTSMLCKKW